jgi:hypothetical protein
MEKVLTLYKEDFANIYIWEDICNVLEVPVSSKELYVMYHKAYLSEQDYENDLLKQDRDTEVHMINW